MLIKMIMYPIVLLSVGFGVGYWLLITAEGKTDALKVIGKILGGVVIIMSILATSLGYYLLADSSNMYPQGMSPIKVFCNHPHEHDGHKMISEDDDNGGHMGGYRGAPPMKMHNEVKAPEKKK